MNDIQRSISSVIKGYTIYLVTNIAMVVIGIAFSISLFIAGILSSFTAKNFVDIESLKNLLSNLDVAVLLSGMLIWLILVLAAVVVSIYGMYRVYVGLKSLATQLDAIGAIAVDNLSTAMLIMMIASICSFIPIWGIFVAIGGFIAALILNVMGYSALRQSTSLNEGGRAAAKQLFGAIVIYIAIFGCILIPVLGWMAIPVLYIIYWVKLFSGWKLLRDSFATCEHQIDNQ